MKLTPNQLKENMEITRMELSDTISSNEFYEQFDHCPYCGKISDGPLTAHDDDEYSFDLIEQRRCNKCLIQWEYTRYYNIKNDPAYKAFMDIRKMPPPPRPSIAFGNESSGTNPPPPRPSGFEPRKVTEAGCLFWIVGGIATLITGIGVLL